MENSPVTEKQNEIQTNCKSLNYRNETENNNKCLTFKQANLTSGHTSAGCEWCLIDTDLSTDSQASLGNQHHPTSFV